MPASRDTTRPPLNVPGVSWTSDNQAAIVTSYDTVRSLTDQLEAAGYEPVGHPERAGLFGYVFRYQNAERLYLEVHYVDAHRRHLPYELVCRFAGNDQWFIVECFGTTMWPTAEDVPLHAVPSGYEHAVRPTLRQPA